MPDLTGIPALDLLIGLSFIFLLLSLFCSAIQEAIAGLLAMRAKTLEQGLRNMLEDHVPGQAPPPPAPNDAGPLQVQVLDNPLIRTLYRDSRIGLRKSLVFIGKVENKAPSYMAPRAFALALVDTLAPGLQTTGANGEPLHSRDVVKALRERVAGLEWLPGNTKSALLRLIDDARGDIDRVRQNVEAWFDDSMARVSGWYKRKAQIVLCVLALLVTVTMNVDTLIIGQTLWKDDAVRSRVVAAANAAAAPSTPAAGGQPGAPAPAPATPDLDKAAQDVSDVKKLGVPMGWNENARDPRHLAAKDWPGKLLGWFLTVVALSLGAPFWFDTLSRLSRLRNSGKPETPLPATGFGKPAERVPDPAPAVVS